MDRDHSRSPRGVGINSADNVDIMRLVVQREQARMAKDFASADSYRQQLSSLGVTLTDKSHTWSASDGRTGRIPTFSEVENGGGDPDVVMQVMEDKASSTSAPVFSTDSEEGHIKSLIQQREQARASKDFARSDQIRDELKGMGVDIFDKDKIWKSSSGLSGVVLGYRSGSGAGPSDVEISTLVQQREKARQNNDYEMGDMIKTELKQWGVEIRDKEKVWRCSDGRTGPVPLWTNIGTGAPTTGSSTAMVAMTPQTNNLNQLLAACVANAQNPATSARTMALLQQAAMVGPASQPHGHSPVYKPPALAAPRSNIKAERPSMKAAKAPMAPKASANTELNDAIAFCNDCQVSGRGVQDDEIMWLVEVREKLRRDKDFAGADNLRNALRSSIGLELHEREKSWVMNDGRRGEIPAWSVLN